MRAFLALSLFAAMNVLAMSSATADPISDLTQMRDAFLALHSFHAEMTTHKGTEVTIDSIRPDRVRATFEGTEAIEIGTAGWVRMGGQWRAFPAAVNMLQRQTAMVGSAAFKERTLSFYTITGAGSAVVRGIATRKYHLASKTNNESVDVFVANQLPVRIVLSGDSSGSDSIDYSQYNAVPAIAPPM